MKVNPSYSRLEVAFTVALFFAGIVLRAARNVEVWIYAATGIALLLFALMMLLAAIERRSYREVSGTLLEFEDETSWLGRRYGLPSRVTLAYTYTIDGTSYSSKRINLRPLSFRQFCGDGDLPNKLRSLALTPTREITVFVRRNDSRSSVLTLRLDQAVIVGFVVAGVASIGFAWSLLWR